MHRKAPLGVHFSLRALLAGVFVFTLLIGPICAARCSLQACVLPASSESSGACHESSGQANAAGWNAATSQGSCAVAELLFTTDRANERVSSHGAVVFAPPLSAARLCGHVAFSSSEAGGTILFRNTLAIGDLPLRL
jgi:hypothetical protein